MKIYFDLCNKYTTVHNFTVITQKIFINSVLYGYIRFYTLSEITEQISLKYFDFMIEQKHIHNVKTNKFFIIFRF